MRRQSFHPSYAAVAVLLSWLVVVPARAAPSYPFGSHPTRYAAGTIRPSHVTAAAQDAARVRAKT